MQLYVFTKNYGVAVILFSVIVKLIMLPFQMKSKRGMMQTSRLQPRLKELEKKHGANKQKYNEEVQKLYREEKINPMSGCIWTLIPFPILLALYQAIRMPLTCMMGVAAELLADGGAIASKLASTGFEQTMNAAYVQIEQTQWISTHFSEFAGITDKLRQIDYSFLGMNLGQKPAWNFLWTTDWSDPSVWLPGLGMFLIPILAGLASYLSAKISAKANNTGSEQVQGMGAMNIIMPLFSVYIGFIMPTALGIYWLVSTILSVIQDVILTKYYTKKMALEDADRLEKQAEREAELDRKRQETERKRAENATERNPNTSKRKQQKTEREVQKAKAAEWERLHSDKAEDEPDPSQVGTRRYARGRAYDPDRFAASGIDSVTETDEEQSPEAAEELPEPIPEPEIPVIPAPAPAEPADEDDFDEPDEPDEDPYEDPDEEEADD
ncbi:MAG: membrane protein insertase YidC [Oscillospiraceae bacterium]|nr:membrane protein insertase YidC [Oscillospiraceae bacterium]